MANTPLEFQAPPGLALEVDLYPSPAAGETAIDEDVETTEPDGNGVYRAIHAGSQIGVLTGIVKLEGNRIGSFYAPVKADDTNVVICCDSYVDARHELMTEDNAGLPRFTEEALAEAPTGGGGGGGGEPGGVSVTIPITDQDSNPIADARVWVTSDADGETLVDGSYRTNTSGEVTFTLIAGNTYYLWAQKAGQQAISGQAFVAVAD